MVQPGRLPLAGGHFTPFAETLRFKGVDLTGGALHAQVRGTPDVAGDPLIDLPQVTVANTTGVRLVAVLTDPDGVTKISVVSLYVAEGLMRALASAGEVGDDVALAWDLLVTPAGGIKQVWLGGSFTVRAGVTQ